MYVYEKEGSLVPGWEFGQSDHIVTQPVQHFRQGDRDYIVFGDGMKTYILDRKGQPRVNINSYFQQSTANTYYLDSPSNANEAHMVTTDSTGKIYFIYFNGKVNTLDIDSFSPEHYFECRDINGDGTYEFIFLDHNVLSVYTRDKTKLFETRFNEEITDRPVYYEFSSNDRKIGVVARKANKIYLVNNDGSIYQGFPRQGNTLFTIGILANNPSGFNLIVGSQNNFLYNYHLQ